MQLAYLFSGLILCKKCGKKFRGKKERGKNVYICSGYSNYGSDFCDRNQIHEDDLLYIVKNHFHVKQINPKEYVKQVEVSGEEVYIYYFDGSQSIFTPNKIIY